MADYNNLTPARPRLAVEPCWMCGTRLPVIEMVADGGSACDSVRWYCHDVKGCTERWTTRTATPTPGPSGSAGTSETRVAAEM